MYNKILLPTDGSDNSKRAGKHAIRLADIYNAHIIILHVIEEYNLQTAVLPISTLPNPDENLFNELEQEGQLIVRDFKKYIKNHCQGKYENIELTNMIREGKPYLEILKTINEEDVDLVVMGSSGRHGLDRIFLGSVTERVVREATKPVMIIP